MAKKDPDLRGRERRPLGGIDLMTTEVKELRRDTATSREIDIVSRMSAGLLAETAGSSLGPAQRGMSGAPNHRRRQPALTSP